VAGADDTDAHLLNHADGLADPGDRDQGPTG